VITKTVLCPIVGGACKLVEVPFNWRPGETLPAGIEGEHFPSVAEALAELAGRGRAASRFHIPKPEPGANN
jgi:hypothetical protein